MTDSQSLHDYESISESVFSSSSSDYSDLEKVEEDLNLLEEFSKPTKPLLDYRSGTKAEPVSQSTVACLHNQLTVQERIVIQQKQLGEITSTLARLMQKSEIDRAQSESSLPPIDWPDFQEYQAVQEKALPGPPPVRLAAPDYEEIAYVSEPDLPSLADIARSTSTRSSTFKTPARDPGTSPELPFSRRASTFKPPVDLPRTNVKSNIRCFTYIDPHRCSVCQGPKLDDHLHLCNRCVLEQEERPHLATVFRSPRVLRANAVGVTLSPEAEPKQAKKGNAWLCCVKSPDHSSSSYKGYEDVYDD